MAPRTTPLLQRLSPRLAIATLLLGAGLGSLVMSLWRFGLPLWAPSQPVQRSDEPMDIAVHRKSMLSSMNMTINAAPRVDPRVVPASQAEMEPAERVIEVEINGVSRVYPINKLEQGYASHVVNDWLGGQPIAVTWCDLTQTGAVYVRDFAGNESPLGVSSFAYGQLWLYTPSQSGTWSQQSGKSSSADGLTLEIIPSKIVTAAEWRAQNPEGEVYDGDGH